MTKLISILIMISALSLAQSEKLDKIELGSGKIILGKVEKIKNNSVEFMENKSNVLYEFKKSHNYRRCCRGGHDRSKAAPQG